MLLQQSSLLLAAPKVLLQQSCLLLAAPKVLLLHFCLLLAAAALKAAWLRLLLPSLGPMLVLVVALKAKRIPLSLLWACNSSSDARTRSSRG